MMLVSRMHNMGALRPKTALLELLQVSPFLWLGCENGSPTARGQVVSLGFVRYESFEKVVANALVWTLLVAAQVLSLAIFTAFVVAVTTLQVLLCLAWLMLGFLVHQMKCMGVGRVCNLFFRVWTGSDAFNVSTNVDKKVMEGSLLAGVLMGNLPQLILQAANNVLTDQWTAVPVLSLVLSSLVVLKTIYELYYRVVNERGVRGDDVTGLGGGHGDVALGNEVQSVERGNTAGEADIDIVVAEVKVGEVGQNNDATNDAPVIVHDEAVGDVEDVSRECAECSLDDDCSLCDRYVEVAAQEGVHETVEL